MTILWRKFTSPATVGGTATIEILGDQLCLDEVFTIQSIGARLSVIAKGGLFAENVYTYTVSLVSKVGTNHTAAGGTPIVVDKDGLSHDILPYAANVLVNFNGDDFKTLTLAGNVAFSGTRHCPGKTVVVRVVNPLGSGRLLNFPASWIFLGTFGRPTSIAAGKVGVLQVSCFGMSDADVVAVWAVQP